MTTDVSFSGPKGCTRPFLDRIDSQYLRAWASCTPTVFILSKLSQAGEETCINFRKQVSY